jgi:hypothetical protein
MDISRHDIARHGRARRRRSVLATPGSPATEPQEWRDVCGVMPARLARAISRLKPVRKAAERAPPATNGRQLSTVASRSNTHRQIGRIDWPSFVLVKRKQPPASSISIHFRFTISPRRQPVSRSKRVPGLDLAERYAKSLIFSGRQSAGALLVGLARHAARRVMLDNSLAHSKSSDGADGSGRCASSAGADHTF